MSMIEVKTADLIGPALDWAVAKANGFAVQVRPYAEFCNASTGHKVKARYHRVWYEFDGDLEEYSPSADWSQGGPLIERFGCDLICIAPGNCWEANCWDCDLPTPGLHLHEAETPLVAALRAIVAAKLGDAVSVPEELVQQPTEGSGDE